MSSTKAAANDGVLRLRLRSMAYLKVAAVTSSRKGGEKRNPLRIVKVYVRPSAETDGSERATSGTSCDPCGPALSG